MKVLDLFSGLYGFSQAFKDRGHDVIGIDLKTKFKPTICQDIFSIDDSFISRIKPDVILASPPCEKFSVAAIGKNWNKQGNPLPDTIKSIQLVKHTLNLIYNYNPAVWVLENPRGMLRTTIGKPAYTITLCQYGDFRMKPTDLWGKLPPGFRARKCMNGDRCHVRTPRHAHLGTQGIKSVAERARMPYGLSLELCLASEAII